MKPIYQSIVITGAKGMLAHDLKRALDARGLKYVGADADTCDLTKPEQVRKFFADSQPTVCFNCAAYTNVDGAETNEPLANAVNGDAVGHLADAAKEYSTKLVHISTDFVFDGKGTRPYLPTDKPDPQSAYARSKLLGETKLQQINPPGWLLARTAWLYGVGGNSFPKTMLTVARAGKPLRVVSDQHGAPTFTVDLVEALLDLVDHDGTGIVHVTNAGQTTWFEFAKAIFEEFGLSPDLQPITSADWKAMKPLSATRPGYSVLDLNAFQQIAGRSMRPWRDALRAYRTLSQA